MRVSVARRRSQVRRRWWLRRVSSSSWRRVSTSRGVSWSCCVGAFCKSSSFVALA
ncbi:hypothetical protein ACXZ9C_11265 [Streptococcus agalactiae]